MFVIKNTLIKCSDHWQVEKRKSLQRQVIKRKERKNIINGGWWGKGKNTSKMFQPIHSYSHNIWIWPEKKYKSSHSVLIRLFKENSCSFQLPFSLKTVYWISYEFYYWRVRYEEAFPHFSAAWNKEPRYAHVLNQLKYFKSVMFYAPLSTENLSKKALVGVEGRKLNSICALGITTAPVSLTLFGSLSNLTGITMNSDTCKTHF